MNKIFKKHKKWVIVIILLLIVMLFNLPTSPSNGETRLEGNVVFDWLGHASYAYVDENTLFSSPIIVNKGAILELEPGIYYWRVSGLGIVNTFEIVPLLEVKTTEKEDYIELENTGNLDAEVEYESKGGITGSFVLEPDETTSVEEKISIIIKAKVKNNE